MYAVLMITLLINESPPVPKIIVSEMSCISSGNGLSPIYISHYNFLSHVKDMDIGKEILAGNMNRPPYDKIMSKM